MYINICHTCEILAFCFLFSSSLWKMVVLTKCGRRFVLNIRNATFKSLFLPFPTMVLNDCHVHVLCYLLKNIVLPWYFFSPVLLNLLTPLMLVYRYYWCLTRDTLVNAWLSYELYSVLTLKINITYYFNTFPFITLSNSQSVAQSQQLPRALHPFMKYRITHGVNNAESSFY